MREFRCHYEETDRLVIAHDGRTVILEVVDRFVDSEEEVYPEIILTKDELGLLIEYLQDVHFQLEDY